MKILFPRKIFPKKSEETDFVKEKEKVSDK